MAVIALPLALALLTGCKSATSITPSAVAANRTWGTGDDFSIEKAARAHAHYGAAVIAEINGQAQEALSEFESAVEEDSANETLVLEVSQRLIRAEQLERALAVINRGLQVPKASGLLYAHKGLICAQLGRTIEAAAADRTAIRKSPESLAGYRNLFVLNLQQHHQQQALAVLEEASTQNKGVSPEFLVGLAELYTTYGQQASASREEAKAKSLALLSRADKLHPKLPATQLALAEQLYLLGEATNSARIYLEVLNQLPDLPELRERIHARLSDIYLHAEDHARAAEQLRALLEEDPTNLQANYFLGAIALEEKKPAEAIEYFRKSILLKQDFEPAYYDLANAQIAAEHPGDALSTLDQARKRFSTTFTGEFLSGVAFARQKAWNEAIQRYTSAEVIARASDTNRLNQFFYFQLGAACERNGDFAEAEHQFSKCLRLAPGFTEAQNYLGYMWAERGTNLDQARDLIEKAVKAEPKNPAYLDSLAWVLFKQGDAKTALPEILKAVELSEEPDATLQDHLGDIYAALGERQKARQAWENSLQIEPNETVRTKLEREQTRTAEPK